MSFKNVHALYRMGVMSIIILLSFILLTTIVSPAILASPTETSPPQTYPTVLKITFVEQPETLRVRVDLNRALPFSLGHLPDPARLIVSLPEVIFLFTPQDISLPKNKLLLGMRFGKFSEGRSRLVFDLSRDVQLQSSRMTPSQGAEPAHLYLDFSLQRQKAGTSSNVLPYQTYQKSAETRPHKKDPISSLYATNRRLVLDAGHGGIDSGAVSPQGTQEKDIVLSFTKRLARLLTEKGYEVFLTRTDDVFLSLTERVAFARAHSPALFLSFHTDFFEQNHIRGLAAYTLSKKASDQLSQRLAEKENLSEYLSQNNAKADDQIVTTILIDLIQQESTILAMTFVDALLTTLKATDIPLPGNPERFANFQVLRAYDVPSVLIELGFLSNQEDERRLLSSDFHRQLSHYFLKAITTYFARTKIHTSEMNPSSAHFPTSPLPEKRPVP